MKGLIKWLLDYAATQRELKRIRVEGKRTQEAKGRALRLREAREYKDKVSRTGNKNPGD